jgi:hypothetical protein
LRLSFSKAFLHPLFLFERKRGKKNQKTCRFIACQFCPLQKVLSPPRAPFLLAQKLPGTTAN